MGAAFACEAAGYPNYSTIIGEISIRKNPRPRKMSERGQSPRTLNRAEKKNKLMKKNTPKISFHPKNQGSQKIDQYMCESLLEEKKEANVEGRLFR